MAIVHDSNRFRGKIVSTTATEKNHQSLKSMIILPHQQQNDDRRFNSSLLVGAPGFVHSDDTHPTSVSGSTSSINATSPLFSSSSSSNQTERMSGVTTRVLGPAAIIGGTISIYTAALSHTSSTLTQLSVLYLFLLALNYCIMPRISKTHIHPQTNKQSLALVEEFVKMLMGVGGFLLFTDGDSINSVMTKWTLSSSWMEAGLPSALYALQGVLTYTAYQNLDSFEFNGLTQMKTLTAALCCYWVLGKAQSPKQIFALVILSVTPLLFEGKFQDMMGKHKKKNDHSYSVVDKGVEKNVWKNRLVWGIVPCLGATLLSGLAGALSQKSLQMSVGSSSMMERNPYFYSAEISFFTAVCLLISMITKRGDYNKKKNDKQQNLSSTTNPHGRLICFEYWSWKTFVPIVVKATGGILTAMVHKHAGSVMKGFSLVLGLIFSALLQTILDGKDLTGGQVIGTGLVLFSSWLHFTSPPS